MKLDNIKSIIGEMIEGRFQLEQNPKFKDELFNLADEDLKYKDILRIKRCGIPVDKWKTLVLIEIEASEESAIKVEFKKAITWISLVKESLLGTENSDLYLFLTFSNEVSEEECLRIESTEQFCRKYVLLPEEDVTEFVNRTFLQKHVVSSDTIDGKDPLERAFSATVTKHSWLTPDMQKRWKKSFSNLSGSDLAEVLLKDEELI